VFQRGGRRMRSQCSIGYRAASPLAITSNGFRLHVSFSLELKANLEISAPWCLADGSRISEFEQTFSPPKKQQTKSLGKRSP